MSTTNQIKNLKLDITKLEKIKTIYETTDNLSGGFYADFINVLNSQISHLEICIKNLQS